MRGADAANAGFQAFPARPARELGAAGWLTAFGLAASVVVLFGVSGGLLWLLGYNYDGLTGSPATKIHPFTYMAATLFIWRALTFGNPVGYCVHVANRRPVAVLLAFAATALLIITVARKGPGMAGVVDTFLGPALFALLLADADERLMARLETLLHIVMAANALMALGEFATKTLIFPYRFDGAVFPTDTRSTALQGHPLANATITACYLLALLSGSRRLPGGLRLMMIGLQSAALVAFGGRSAMVVAIVLGGAYAAGAILRTLRMGRVPLLGAAVGILLLALVPVVIGFLASAGFFDALLSRFTSDGGSANARVQMLELFRHISLEDLIVGPDVQLVESLRRINGLEWGIENPIIRMTLYQGAFLTLVMTIVFGLFMYELTRGCEPGAWLPMIGWLILLNTAETIAGKTTVLAKFSIIILCMYRRSGAIAARRLSRVASPVPAPR